LAVVSAGAMVPGFRAPPAGRGPEGIEFQTKPEIAVQQIRKALEQQMAAGVVLADAGYGKGTPFAPLSPSSDCPIW